MDLRYAGTNDKRKGEAAMSDSEISKEASRLISRLKSVGYGWAKFAESVERSGRCTQRQLETMMSMDERIEAHMLSCDYAMPPMSRLSPLEQLEEERRKVRELEREIEQAKIDRLMAKINGTDDTHIGPP